MADMSNWIAYAVFGYILLQLIIAAAAARFIKTETDYLLAGRSLGVPLASLSLFATWFGAETVLGSSGAVAAQGLSGGRADPFGYTICLLLMAALLAAQMRARGYFTLGDFFRDRYGHGAEKLAAIIMIPTSVIWAAAQILALANILTAVTPLSITYSLLFSVAIVVLYSTLGGMLGDVVTDCLQGAVIIIGLAILLYLVVDAAGGISAAVSAVAPERLRLISGEESLLAQIDGWMVPILGSLVAQEAMSRLLATRSPRIARQSCLAAAAIYITVGSIPVVIGLAGVALIPPAETQDAFLPALAAEIMPPVLHVLFLGALVSAILSTIDSALLAVTALATHNLVIPIFPRLGERGRLRLNRLFTLIAGICCYFIAVGGDSIFELVQLSSSFGSAGIVICVLAGLYLKHGNQITAILTLATGIIMTLAGEFFIEFEAPYLTAVLACAGVYAVGAFMQRVRSTMA
jgi:SSS family transporter